jgi:hypothetical protein
MDSLRPIPLEVRRFGVRKCGSNGSSAPHPGRSTPFYRFPKADVVLGGLEGSWLQLPGIPIPKDASAVGGAEIGAERVT